MSFLGVVAQVCSVRSLLFVIVKDRRGDTQRLVMVSSSYSSSCVIRWQCGSSVSRRGEDKPDEGEKETPASPAAPPPCTEVEEETEGEGGGIGGWGGDWLPRRPRTVLVRILKCCLCLVPWPL